ncbi:hypothetical protein OEZ86_011705 [Tetradesmus obliquus]|nr:hypothetical protein OEZ86_011705 [Tetradesmus obliquus]
MPAGSLGYMVYRIRVLPAPPGPNFNDGVDGPAHRGIETPWCQAQLCSDSHQPQRKADIFELGAFRTYVECERKLREQGLVHADGTLKMQLLIKDVQ